MAKIAPAVVSPTQPAAPPTPKITIKEALAEHSARTPAEPAVAVVAEQAAPVAQRHSETSQPPSVLAIRTNEMTKAPASPSTSNPFAAPLTRPIVVDTAPAIEQQVAPRRAPSPQQPASGAPAQDEMAALRQLLAAAAANNAAAQPAEQTGSNATPASKPAATQPGAAPVHARPKITRVGEGDDHLTLDFQEADIRDVLEMISEEGRLNILPSNNVKGKVSASLHDVDLQTALSAILKSSGYVLRQHGKFIYVGTAQDFQNLEQSLDRIGTRIYRTNYVRAADLQALITPLLTQGVGAISVTAAAEQGIATDGNKAGGNSFAGGEAVLVRDYEAVLAQIDQVVAEIDRRPLQVAIEAMILSVKLDDSNQFGVNFALLRDKAHLVLASGSPPASLGDVNLTSGGLNFGFLDSTLAVFINALETVGDTHVIATPRVVCLDKQKAEILIGSQLGYVSSTVTETSTAQNINFLEVGTQLRLRPFISSDGLIRMEVHPELSTGQVTVQQGFTLPQKDLTQVTTNVMVRDGATVVIGGLIREDLTTDTSQIPLLGELPGVGFLFRQKKETTQRSEILVLLTPHIVYDCEAASEGAQAAEDFHRREAVYADSMSPIGKRHLGRQYLRLAQEAWTHGDQPLALRFVDLAIHFDPLNRAAIDLRVDIMTGNHAGRHTAVEFPAPGDGAPAPSGLPGWTLNALEAPPAPTPPTGAANPEAIPAPPGIPGAPSGGIPYGPPIAIPLHPLDPGIPGDSSNIDRPHQFVPQQ